MQPEFSPSQPGLKPRPPTLLPGILAFLWWPLLLGFGVSCLAAGMARGSGPLYFNVAYAVIALALFFLERRWPHEPRWLESDGQLWPDLAHTVLGKGLVEMAVVMGATVGLSQAVGQRPAGAYWPVHWPLAGQVALALLIVEFGLYWAHRLAHEVPLLWRFHAVHHSSTRLWFFNTGRFHFVDTLKSVLLGLPPLFLAGAPGPIFVWVSGCTAFVGILTHCNVAMRFGPLSRVFNTPGLHRWHHSTDPHEGNKNYGENLVLFDQLFGTYFNPNRRPPAVIGIREAMPPTFLGQLKAPFVWGQYQRLPAGKPGRG